MMAARVQHDELAVLWDWFSTSFGGGCLKGRGGGGSVIYLVIRFDLVKF